MARLKETYLNEVRPALMERFGYSSVMQAPKIEKIVLNMGVGEAKQDSKLLDAARASRSLSSSCARAWPSVSR